MVAFSTVPNLKSRVPKFHSMDLRCELPGARITLSSPIFQTMLHYPLCAVFSLFLLPPIEPIKYYRQCRCFFCTLSVQKKQPLFAKRWSGTRYQCPRTAHHNDLCLAEADAIQMPAQVDRLFCLSVVTITLRYLFPNDYASYRTTKEDKAEGYPADGRRHRMLDWHRPLFRYSME